MADQYYDWDPEKNEWLLEERGISFEMVIAAIDEGNLLDILQNKSPKDHQLLYIVLINEYVHVVPAVVDEEKVFLKTVYPSRNMHQKYYEQE